MSKKQLDVNKLKSNALTSIRLGIEDFKKSQLPKEEGGDPERALSAARNLFSGILLLFKYKIAISVITPEDAVDLIFNPQEISPYPDGNGGVKWKIDKTKGNQTIDVNTIKKRFDSFKIFVNWDSIDKLNKSRNALEHLHPTEHNGQIAEFVANLFPILSEFIENHLSKRPAELLGSTWEIMLRHHDFFKHQLADCIAKWENAGVPELMFPYLKKCHCNQCNSPLIKPCSKNLDDGMTVDSSADKFQYTCVACGHEDLIAPLMIENLQDEDYLDLRDAGHLCIEECNECGNSTFHIYDQLCYWCNSKPQYSACKFCGELLKQEDQASGGLCGYHQRVSEKADLYGQEFLSHPPAYNLEKLGIYDEFGDYPES